MAKAFYVGVGGVARKVKKPYIGVNSVARKVTNGYIGVNGVARKMFTLNNMAYPSSITPGNVISWDNHTWLITHYDSANKYLYLHYNGTIEEADTGMARANISSSGTPYNQQEIYTKVKSFEDNKLSASAKQCLADITISGTSGKAFIATYDQMVSTWDWYRAGASTAYRRRAWSYYEYYWTSSLGTFGDDLRSYCVASNGKVYLGQPNNYSWYVRPAICIDLKRW